MSANNTQIGGKHYKSEYQHWDFVQDMGLGYLIGCATKYVARHRKKNGKQDLEKAVHYINKHTETNRGETHKNTTKRKTINCFVADNNIGQREAWVVEYLCKGRNNDALMVMQDLIEEYEEDEEFHKRQEEEEYAGMANPFGYEGGEL